MLLVQLVPINGTEAISVASGTQKAWQDGKAVETARFWALVTLPWVVEWV
ncbi:hypothetical protein GCM10010489_02620 [Microbacterium saperdae]|nr:hypothetical protein GCM10010489_02620 [Microbacterium saperdae]